MLKDDLSSDFQNFHIPRSCACNTINSRDESNSTMLFSTDCKGNSQRTEF